MKKLILIISLYIGVFATPPIIQHAISDDGFTVIPLQFGFPFYGKTFTHSVMYDNGVVGFFDPVANLGCNPATQWCGGQNWSSVNPSTSTGPAFNYMIAPLFADLAPNSQTRYLTQGDNTFQRYMWENIHEYYSGGSRLNTFGLEIFPSGDANTYYQNVNMMSSNIFIGSIGNASQGEWDKKAYYPANTVVNHVDDWSIIGVPIDPCLTDPLSSISCPGYSTAYMTQQCTINPLYDSSCPGYPQAYYNQQCTLSALYDSGCPGYNEAYFYYVCTDNPLYDIGCPGYATAYFNQQCSINPLYSTDCSGYAEAYFLLQCSLNPLYTNTCPGYEVAYHAQQCDLNPLYATDCPLYAVTIAKQVIATNSSSVSTETATVSPTEPVIVVTVPTVSSAETNPVTIATVSPSTTSVSSVTSPISVVNPPKVTLIEPKVEAKKEDKKDTKAVNVAKVKEDMVNKGKTLADDMSKAATLEAQQQVQSQVLGAMSYVAGVDAYYKSLYSVQPFYMQEQVYKYSKIQDSKIGKRNNFAQQLLHQKMVDSQYKINDLKDQSYKGGNYGN